MPTITITQALTISDEALALLRKFENANTRLEHKDGEEFSFYQKGEIYRRIPSPETTIDAYLELCNAGLIDDDLDTWHLTYMLTPLGLVGLASGIIE